MTGMSVFSLFVQWRIQGKGPGDPAPLIFQPNRSFYRYGGHIELILFKEYYRMPREHEHISFVFLSAFRDTFS